MKNIFNIIFPKFKNPLETTAAASEKPVKLAISLLHDNQEPVKNCGQIRIISNYYKGKRFLYICEKLATFLEDKEFLNLNSDEIDEYEDLMSDFLYLLALLKNDDKS